VFWLHDEPLELGAAIGVRVGMAERRGTIALIENAVDPGELSPIEAKIIARNHVGEIEIALAAPIAADIYADNPRTGRLVLELGGRIAGGGLILAVDGNASAEDRSDRGAGRAELSLQAARLNIELADLPAVERLKRFREEVAGPLVFTTSFGLEDQVIVQMICEAGIDLDIVTLDTGRLFPETYQVWAETERRYGRRIRAIYPQHNKLEALVGKYGIDGFYESREARLACCHARKVEPLDRALSGAQGWIVGVRADQSGNRQGTALVAVDARHLLKLSPLLDWTRDKAQSFAADNQIPVNTLHAQGFASIGCAPCTRAIAPGEPERAGRWWWETDEQKECGLHISSDGRVIGAAKG
jgi:phosphoadenosine phosphosulfate reductase